MRALCHKAPVVFGDGSQTRDFTHVYDTAATIARAGTAPDVVGETLNVGSCFELRVRELARVVLEAVGKPELPIEHIEPRPGDVLRLYADSTKAQRLLGHEPTVSLHDGIADLAARLRALGTGNLEALERGIVLRNWA